MIICDYTFQRLKKFIFSIIPVSISRILSSFILYADWTIVGVICMRPWESFEYIKFCKLTEILRYIDGLRTL